MKVLAGIIGGLILAIGEILVTVTFAASPEKGGSWGGQSAFLYSGSWALLLL